MWGGFFPIIAPYEELGTPMDARMTNFHIASVTDDGPTFAWNTHRMDPFCTDEEILYEVQYAPYNSDDWTSLTTTDSTLSILDDFVPGRSYQARARAYRHHICPIHDTLVWGVWSRTIRFLVGDIPPDSTDIASTQGNPDALFSLSPNPTTGKVTLQSKIQNGEISVSNTAGHEVLKQTLPAGQNTAVLDLSHLPVGVYFVTLTAAGLSATQRLLLQ